MTDLFLKEAMQRSNTFKAAYVPKEVRQRACDDFRATHFILGKSPSVRASTARLSTANKAQRPMTAANERNA